MIQVQHQVVSFTFLKRINLKVKPTSNKAIINKGECKTYSPLFFVCIIFFEKIMYNEEERLKNGENRE